MKMFFNDVNEERGGIETCSLQHWGCWCLQLNIYPILALYMEQRHCAFCTEVLDLTAFLL